MKKLYAIALALIPLLGFSQLTITESAYTFKDGFQGEDFGFYRWTINNSGTDSIGVSWRLTHDLASSDGDWEDYMCEGLLVCWPSSKRSNTFDLAPGDSMDLQHHILTMNDGDSGTWVSELIVFVDGDSANTVEIFQDTAKTGLIVDVDGKTVYIIDGDSFELFGGEFVPLSVEAMEFATAEAFLEQNAPNPFAGNTTINYQLNADQGAIKFHDLTGKLVKEVQLNNHAGQVTLRGELEAGIYFYSLWEDGSMIDSKRMQVID